jgi:signal transduction histidine kinase
VPTTMPGTIIRTRTHKAWQSRRSERSPCGAARLGSRSHTVNAAMLQERARIARELHDSVSQTLYAITLTASRALHLLNQSDAKQTQEVLGDVLRLADTGQAELRSLLANMRSDLLISGGLSGGLATLAAEWRARNGLDIHLSLPEEPDVPEPTKDALVLICREALHNVVKHARADHVEIVLEVNAEALVLVITDDGRGFDAAASRPGHFGLQSMRERATAAGGVLTLISGEGIGTKVTVRVPRDRSGAWVYPTQEDTDG